MKTKDARLLIAAIARAVKQRFTTRADHAALQTRVEQLENAIAELKSKSEKAA